MTKKIKVILAQFPLENHSRGIITVAGMLRDAGMEVVLIGNDLPKRIIDTAVQEDVDVVGISTYCGGELALSTDLINAAEARGIKERTVFVLGGIYPPHNGPKIKKLGFSGVFPPSSTKEQIVSHLTKSVAAKRKKLRHAGAS